MKEIKRKVHKIRIDCVCQKCEEGKMIYKCDCTGEKRFLHECDVCEYEICLESQYPHFHEETDSWRIE